VSGGKSMSSTKQPNEKAPGPIAGYRPGTLVAGSTCSSAARRAFFLFRQLGMVPPLIRCAFLSAG